MKTIAELIIPGIVIGAADLLRNPDNTQMAGITEHARRDNVWIVGSTRVQAVTIKNWPGYAKNTLDGRSRVFLNGSAFSGGNLSLREVLVYELLHVAGWPAEEVGLLGTLLGKTDLSHSDKYDEIMAACK